MKIKAIPFILGAWIPVWAFGFSPDIAGGITAVLLLLAATKQIKLL